MRDWIALCGLGTGLFVVALLGTLAVQGRLDHAGTRGVPVISWLFSAPEVAEDLEAVPEEGVGEETSRPQPSEAAASASGTGLGGPRETDTGGLFAFPQLDSGISSDELEAILRAAREVEDEARRERARLEAVEADLLGRQRDLEDRESSIAAQMIRVDQERDRLEDRIAEFERRVLLVERDELQGLREYGRTLAAFDPDRAAAIVLEEWPSDEGRKRITKVLAVMDPVDADSILAAIDEGRVREVLLERLKIVHQPRGR